MAEKKDPPSGLGNTEESIDDQDVALEESEEEDDENAVVEEADANLKEDPINLRDGRLAP